MGNGERVGNLLDDHFQAVVYALTDPRTQAVRYVGVTGWPERRLAQHLQDASATGTKRQKWLYDLAAGGLKPGMMELATVPWTKRWEEEQRHMERLRSEGAELLNGDVSVAATAVDPDVLNRFRQAVMRHRGKLRGAMKEEATRALEDRIEELERGDKP